MTTPAAATRRPGRPRDADLDDAILDAALELFCEVGYEGLAIEAVAARAGCAKTTVYRRYPRKVDLVLDAVGVVGRAFVPEPDTGSLRDDLRAIGAGYLALLTHPRAGRAIPMMLAGKAQCPELAAAHDEFVRARRRHSVAIVRAGIDRGELPPGTDAEMFADAVTGALFVRVFVTGRPVDDRYVGELVDRLLA